MDQITAVEGDISELMKLQHTFWEKLRSDHHRLKDSTLELIEVSELLHNKMCIWSGLKRRNRIFKQTSTDGHPNFQKTPISYHKTNTAFLRLSTDGTLTTLVHTFAPTGKRQKLRNNPCPHASGPSFMNGGQDLSGKTTRPQSN